MAPPAPGAVGTALQVQLFDAFLGQRSVRDIAWLAGLLEGEGCFSKRGNCITIQLYMADRDVVERAARLLGALSVGVRDYTNSKWKTCYYCTVSGPPAAAWMMTLYGLMGTRRQARIRELLVIFKKAKTQYASTLVCPHVADHRRHRTVCDKCYSHDWYIRHKQKKTVAA
jgi:hypothetical protein